MNPFWQFSLQLYGQPQVERLCLQLQARFDIDVNLLLWSCWLQALGVPLGAGLLAQARDTVGDWNRQVVKPLRRVRTTVKRGDWPGGGDLPALLEQCRQLELEAEKQQQQWLYQLAEDHGLQADETAALQPGENIERLLRALGARDCRPAIELLSAAIAGTLRR